MHVDTSGQYGLALNVTWLEPKTKDFRPDLHNDWERSHFIQGQRPTFG